MGFDVVRGSNSKEERKGSVVGRSVARINTSASSQIRLKWLSRSRSELG